MVSTPAEVGERPLLTILSTQVSAENSGNTEEIPDFIDNRGLERTAPSAGVLNAGVAQRLEHLAYTQGVGDSNSSARTISTTKGRVSLIDENDFIRFGHLKWTAGSFSGKTHYVYRSVWGDDGKCRTILLHRAIMNAQKGQIVDHINGDTFDNRRANLRFASHRQNAFNCRRQPSKHGFIGIDSQTPGAWRGRVSVGRRSRYTATFACPVLAAAARDVLAKELHGDYAVLNFTFTPVEARP